MRGIQAHRCRGQARAATDTQNVLDLQILMTSTPLIFMPLNHFQSYLSVREAGIEQA